MNEIDWSATGDMLSGIGTLAGAIVVAIGAWVGRDVLRTYVSQRRSERKLAHAESILTAAYRLEMALESIRSPMSTSGELAESKKSLEENGHPHLQDDARSQRLIQANVFYVRARQFSADFDQAIDLLPVAAAFFGSEVKGSLEKLIRNRNTVKIYADSYARDIGNNHDFSRKIEIAIWKGAAVEDEADEVSMSTSAAIVNLEHHLFPIVRGDPRKPPKTETINA